MKRARILAASIAALSAATMAFAADQPQTAPKPDNYSGKFFKSDESVTGGSVNGIAYQATAGTLVVHPKGWNDSAQNGGDKNPDAKGDESSAEASMFFVYYAKRGSPPARRAWRSTRRTSTLRPRIRHLSHRGSCRRRSARNRSSLWDGRRVFRLSPDRRCRSPIHP